MGGKRRAQPSGEAQDKAAANQAQGGSSLKRQTRGRSVHDGAEGGSCGQEESGSILAHRQPVTMCFSMHCDPSALVAGRKAAMEAAAEAALSKVLSEFGCREVGVYWTRVGPSEDTLQRVLPMVLERLELEGAAQCFKVCKSWTGELEARGFCIKTAQLCAALAGGGDVSERLLQNAWRVLRQISLRTLNPIPGDDAQRALCLDGVAFLDKSERWRGTPQEWLQAASEEPDASFLSRGATATAQSLGLALLRWVGKPQGRYPAFYVPPGHSYLVVALAFSREGTRVVSASNDKLVRIWNAETGAEVHVLTELTGTYGPSVRSVSFSPDGTRVCSASYAKLVKSWDAETGAEICGSPAYITFSPDGTRFVSGWSDQQLLTILDAGTGAKMCTLAGHSYRDGKVWFSRNGKRVFCWSDEYDDILQIWDAATGAEICTVTDQSDLLNWFDSSPNGKLVVSGSGDNLVRIWNAETGAVVRTLTGHSHSVTRVEFSHDGTQVISGSKDDTVRVWDVASGRQVRQLAGSMFALVEGLSDEHTRVRHVITARWDMLMIYEVEKEQLHAEDGAAAAPVAFFKAPQHIAQLGCHGASICVGCREGAVCVLSAPFLAA